MDISPKNLKYIHGVMMDWFGVDLTDAQIEQFGKRDRQLWTDMVAGEFDTVCREQLADEVVREVLGSGERWPRYGGGSPAFAQFVERFHQAAKSKGVKTL